MSTTRNGSLTARSVVASVLLGTDPPWLPTPLLLRTTDLFGISEGTARTALSRMVAAGEAEADAGGYRLVGRLVARQTRQSASRRAERRRWTGGWELAEVDATSGRRAAPDRAALRDALRALRLVELREGLWGRPDNLDPARSPEARDLADRWCRWWRGARPDPTPPLDAWDLEGWATGAGELQAAMAALVGPLEAHDRGALRDGFVTSAAVLRHLQADPLLPAELLPAEWPGDVLRHDYDRYDRAYRAVLRTWFAESTPPRRE